MPKILITGNGFDLNIGLPTSYSDFIKILVFVEKNNVLDFDSVYSNCSDYITIQERFRTFKFDGSNIINLKREISKNLWFRFFKDEFEIETWIDFENKIEYVLKNLFSSLEYIKTNIFSQGSLSETQDYYNKHIFNNDIEIIQVLNTFKIIELDKDGDIVLNIEFLLKKYGHFVNIDLDKINTYLYQELVEFKRIFNYYFETFIYPFYDNFKVSIDKNMFSSINKHYTFNYTPTFEKVYGIPRVTSFLHGKINSIENKIVIGINEIPESAKLNKKFFLPFTKYYQKLNNNTDYIFIKEYETKTSENYLFFFLGHSLDKSDEDYINEIFDFIISLKTKTKKIIIIYHNEDSKSKLLINLLNIRGKKDIQELMRSQILTFIHIDSSDLKKELGRDLTRRTGISVTHS